MRIDKDEWYPVYDLYDGAYGLEVPVPGDLIERFNAAKAAFESVQEELENLYEAESDRRAAERQRAADVEFVQRQRPWWSHARCEALVDSRRRSRRSLRQAVPAAA